jgi:hypothetical protein
MRACTNLKLAGLILALITLAMPAISQEIAHGNGALELFDAEGMANAPDWVKVWIGIMIGTFLVGLGFAIKRVQARWVMGFIVAGFITMGVLTSGFGVPQISGFIALIHLIFWTPALVILLRQRTFLKGSTRFARWTGLITFVILFSFVFDIRDAAIYLDHVMGLGLLN